GIHIVDCPSHRFSLAASDYLKDYTLLLAKINTQMTKLQTIKGRVILRRVTDLSFLLRNDTRWSSTNALVQSYTQLKTALNFLGYGTLVEIGIQPLLLRRAKSKRVHAFLKRYPQPKSCLSPTAAIVNNVHLESGTINFRRKESLVAAEHVACAEFRRADHGTTKATPYSQPTSELSLVQQAFKRNKTAKRSRYTDVSLVPPTFNKCGCYFSSTKLVYSDLRRLLDSSVLETFRHQQYLPIPTVLNKNAAHSAHLGIAFCRIYQPVE
ncbi:hypothetical protein GN958_ATG20135, partial [Phytophthora infestans]